jgi:hypothetical protein
MTSNKPTAATPSRTYADRDLKLLWGLAAAHCSRCRCAVVAVATPHDKAAILGEIAHIVAHGKGARAPRLDADFPDSDRDKYENLILLCPTCHTEVDKQHATFSVAQLRGLKSEHEAWVRGRLRAAVPAVGFAQLQVVAAAMVNAPVGPPPDLLLIDPAAKMAKNGLTDRVRFNLTLGLSKAYEVDRFVVHIAAVDPTFPDALRARFVQQYTALKADGVEGDALFEALRLFATNGHHDFALQAAGLAVLAYLFEKCEVFER